MPLLCDHPSCWMTGWIAWRQDILTASNSDFEKAFDRVPQRRLVSKVQSYKISNIIIDWIVLDFLKARKFRVRVLLLLQPFYMLLSGTTRMSRYQDKPFWILLFKQRWWGGSGISCTICKSFAFRSWQIGMPAPRHPSLLRTGCSSCCPTNSVKALKATFRVRVNGSYSAAGLHIYNNIK